MVDLSNILSNKLDKDFLVQLFNEQKEVYQSAIAISLQNKQPTSWRAAWILAHCTKPNDPRMIPHIDTYIQNIADKKDGHQREILKILYPMVLNEEQEGKLFDLSMRFWENIHKSSSLRYLAFKHIYKTAEKHPELLDEITYICQNQYLETLSPGIQKIIIKMRNVLNS